MALRVGIVSANWGTLAHLPAWRAVPGIEVVGICTSRRETAEAAAAAHGIARPFWDAAAMAADPGIDIVDVGTRPVLREGMIRACLAHGKHVYAGIPFAATLDGARDLHDRWRDSGGVVGVVDAYLQWLPPFRVLGTMIDDGYLGRPFGGTAKFNMALFNPLAPGFPYNWFAEAGQGVSAVRNLGSHALHLLTHLLGDVEELVAHDARLLDRWTAPSGETIAVETNDFADMILRFENGLVLQFQVSWNATLGDGWSLDLFGKEGRITAAGAMFPTSRGTVVRAGRRGDGSLSPVAVPEALFASADVAIDADHPMPPSYPMALAMNAMARAIEGGGAAAAPDFARAWSVERLLEAVRVSSAERRWVRVDEIGRNAIPA